jgi:hypothetical protein
MNPAYSNLNLREVTVLFGDAPPGFNEVVEHLPYSDSEGDNYVFERSAVLETKLEESWCDDEKALHHELTTAFTIWPEIAQIVLQPK